MELVGVPNDLGNEESLAAVSNVVYIKYVFFKEMTILNQEVISKLQILSLKKLLERFIKKKKKKFFKNNF